MLISLTIKNILFRVSINDLPTRAIDDVQTLEANNLDWYYDQSTEFLQIRLSNDKDASRKKRAAIAINDPDFTNIDFSPNIYRLIYSCTVVFKYITKN